MNFQSLITRSPIPYNAEQGAEIKALFSELPAEVQELIAGTAGCSPYLRGLLQKERDWLLEALSGDPHAAMDGLLDEVRAMAPDRLKSGLRMGKRRMAILTALCDLGGAWPVLEVTRALTDYADLATDRALKSCVGDMIRRGKIPGQTEEDIETAGGVVALAMGKMGAHELNYSSDVDLIVLFDDARFEGLDYMEARQGFIRATRNMSAMMSDITGEGYVFRTDLRLRPDPSTTPVCMAMEAAERYYESVGRTWERAAHIKARPCAGDVRAGEEYLKRLRPFIWRKHLDFAAIQDAHDMRLRIREHKGLGGPITLEGHNMKLGRGGIREIEFFVQTRQIIAGGRDESLRSRETLSALSALVDKGWVGKDVAKVLEKHYLDHREVEHRLQMVNDAQTHDLPNSADGFERLAAFMGETDTKALRRRLHDALEEVHETTESFFTPDAAAQTPELSGTEAEITARWPTYPALRSERAVEIFERLRPVILERLQKAARPDEALVNFDEFLRGLPAGVQLFSLFEANTQLIDLLVDIVSTAPALSSHLSRHSGVFDAVIGGSFFSEWPEVDGLKQALAKELAPIEDYERRLDRVRRWMKEWHFRIGVHHLRGLIDMETAGAQYAQLAEVVVALTWQDVVAEFARKHGPQPGRGAVVLGMGSMGAGRLNAGSDLDLVVVFDAQDVDMSEGKRPLGTRPYYARLTQALVTALSAPMSEGKLYEVDMRLRPSGRQGPVASALQGFKEYQKHEAWTWEHLALTRARPIAGNMDLGEEIIDFAHDLLPEKADAKKILPDVQEMRDRLAQAKPGKGVFETKAGPGRIMDIELLAQAATVLSRSTARSTTDQLMAGRMSGFLSEAAHARLTEALHLYWSVLGPSRLMEEKELDPEHIGEGGVQFLLRSTGAENLDALILDLQATQNDVSAIVDDALRHVTWTLD
ncbi:MAG: glutamine-synthetase adenylyltransferase [Halocynthiibacter sp.]